MAAPDLKDILDLLASPTEEDIALVTKAYEFSERAHEGQKRYSGEPYFVHAFETARTLAELGMSPATISAGLLHDVIEDVGVTPEEMEREFGRETLFLVQGVTKLGNLKYRGSNWHTESLRKLFVAISQDIRVLMIKLADRLHNIRTIAAVPAEKQFRIASETLEVYAPIAYRLGIGRLSRELEDRAFPYVYPKEYETVQALVTRRREEQEQSLETFHKALQKALADEGYKSASTSYRVKGLYSLYRKLARYDMDIEKVYDISALRVIVDNVPDCYRILGIIHGNWRPLPGRIKDFIAFPKPNGYQSLHTTVFTGDGGLVEVQIRTREMHRDAEYGIASHLSYKQSYSKQKANPAFLWIRRLIPSDDAAHESGSTGATDIPGWIKELVEYQKANGENEFKESLKADFFQQRIFVFTPKGDVVDLPIDSTPIDFAYAVHSNIGHHMAGAKVNGKLVSLDTKLQNGDIVEIQTKKSAKPSQKWIEYAKTTMAKRHIRQVLQNPDRLKE